jgi:hypothetical protein
MNEESLKRANAFLAAVALRVEVGETLDAAPTDIAQDKEAPWSPLRMSPILLLLPTDKPEPFSRHSAPFCDRMATLSHRKQAGCPPRTNWTLWVTSTH